MNRALDIGRLPLVLALVVGVAVTVSSCSQSTGSQAPTAPAISASPEASPEGTEPEPSPTSTPSQNPSPADSEIIAASLSPLTGLPQEEPAPVLVVKLDNTRNALPHAGLKSADLVYIEEVEYGITRLAAVFSSHVPHRIGPVRSARITDIDLLEQYGSPGFAFSGAQRRLWPALNAAPFVDLSANKDAADYSRDFSRRAPYNYFFDGKVALKNAKGVSTDQNMGFLFESAMPSGGSYNNAATLQWGYASARFVYDPLKRKYAVRLNGERATAEEEDGLQWADTVVIQQVKQTQSKYFDKGGGNTPHAETIGQGQAIVLRNGFAFPVSWSRPDAKSGTTFTQTDGSTMAFKPGQTWIALYDERRPVKLKPKSR